MKKLNTIKSKAAELAVISMMVALGSLSNAFAQDRGGNGGDAVICPAQAPILLDFFEAKNRFKFDLGATTLSVREKVELALKNIKMFDLTRYELLSKSADQLLTDIENFETTGVDRQKNSFFTSDQLADIEDSKETIVPEGCVKRQLVIQKQVIFDEDRLYNIQKQIWIQMDNDQKALTVLHEVIYGMTLSYGAQDSRFARYFNGLLASVEGKELQLANYLSVLSKTRLFGMDKMATTITRKIGMNVKTISAEPDRYTVQPDGSVWFDMFSGVWTDGTKVLISSKGELLISSYFGSVYSGMNVNKRYLLDATFIYKITPDGAMINRNSTLVTVSHVTGLILSVHNEFAMKVIDLETGEVLSRTAKTVSFNQDGTISAISKE
jgi:hypothetical protein